jgi:hypothetical protein
MKKIWIAGLLVILAGCGLEKNMDSEPVVQNSAEETFEGYYLLPNGGYIDIYDDSQGLYSVRTSRLIFENADLSTGLLPVSTLASLPQVNGMIYSNANATYNATTHNIKQDSNNTALVGSFLTQIQITKENGVLKVRAVISNSSGQLFDHTITEE